MQAGRDLVHSALGMFKKGDKDANSVRSRNRLKSPLKNDKRSLLSWQLGPTGTMIKACGGSFQP
eukprot:551223-Amphidinium_carterae.1